MVNYNSNPEMMNSAGFALQTMQSMSLHPHSTTALLRQYFEHTAG